ncbi:MAG: ATP-binding cassette domain-containing protein [Verrucomicrobiales bacterium]
MATVPPINYSEPAIEVLNLHRTFGTLPAVAGVSFQVAHGQVVGFVGANGAGKTTTMRILATLDYPTAGEARIGGYNVVHYPSQVRRLLGWMPDSFGTYEHMTVLEYMDFYARALGYRGAERCQRIEEVMDFTDLTPLADRLVNQLSKGQAQRLCLARALSHDPQILILDEPAAGLDPKARIELKNLLRILSEEGKTILISSHILSELGEMCDSLLFVDKGRIVHHGDATSLQRNGREETVVRVEIGAGDPRQITQWALTAAHVKLVEESKHGARLKIDSDNADVIAGVLRRMITDGLPIVEFHREERRLEEAFIDMLGEIDRGTFVSSTALPTPPPLPGALPIPAIDTSSRFIQPETPTNPPI